MLANDGDGLLAVVGVGMGCIVNYGGVNPCVGDGDSGDLGCDGGDKNCDLQQGQDDYFEGGLQRQAWPRLTNLWWLTKSQ